MSYMSREGKYAAWFRTPRGEGTGVVHIADGKICGGDSTFDYAGSYEIDEDQFTATLVTRRYGSGPTTLFGLDEVVVKLKGFFKGRTVLCSGVAEQAPDIRFEATLFPSHDEVRPAEVKREVATFDPAKLPKSDGDRRRARNPFGTDRPIDRMCTAGPPRRS